jgi:hypothetical protein
MSSMKKHFSEYLKERKITGDEIRLDVIHDFLALYELPMFISVPDAGALIGVSRNEAYKMARDGRLPIVHVTGPGRKRIMVNTRKFLELLEES